MPKTVQEIMNRELFTLREEEGSADALGFLLALGIGGAPILDASGRPIGMVSLHDLAHAAPGASVGGSMESPVDTVQADDAIERAAFRLAESGRHRLVVVDKEGAAVGIVSSVDLVRGLLGMPARHPAAFPHYDTATGLIWTDDALLDAEHVDRAPDGPGVLALVHGGIGSVERVVWAEACGNVRTRVHDLLSMPQSDQPQLARMLRAGHLRFRAASVRDPAARDRAARAVQADALAAMRSPQRGAA